MKDQCLLVSLSSTKLTAKERNQIILDHLQGIPNRVYDVIEMKNGSYRVSPKKIESEAPPPPQRPPVDPIGDREEEAPKPKPKGNARLSNEDIMTHLSTLIQAQMNTPQPSPPIEVTRTQKEDALMIERLNRAVTSPQPQQPFSGRR